MPIINDTITLGGTAQTLLPAKTWRNHVIVNALDEDLWINPLGEAAIDDGILVPGGGGIERNCNMNPEWRGEISVIATTTGSRVSVEEW